MYYRCMKYTSITVRELKQENVWETVCDMLGLLGEEGNMRNDAEITLSEGQLKQLRSIRNTKESVV